MQVKEKNVYLTDNLCIDISFHTITQQTSSHAYGCIALDITENETAAFCLSLPLPFNARLTDPLIAFHTDSTDDRLGFIVAGKRIDSTAEHEHIERPEIENRMERADSQTVG